MRSASSATCWTKDSSRCTCGDVNGDCDGTVTLYNTSNCQLPLMGQGLGFIGVDGDCQQGENSLTAFGVRAIGVSPVDPQCSPSTSIENGSIAATGPVTQCCLAPD